MIPRTQIQRYIVEEQDDEPHWGIIDTQREASPGDKGGLFLGALYQRELAENIASLLSGSSYDSTVRSAP